MLAEGVLEDDGADRGIIFVAAGARLDRQFEFVKTQWINEGVFVGSPDDKDPLVGPDDGSGQFTIPQRPIRRRLTDLPGFVVNRGGEYCIIPRLSALRWLSELDTPEPNSATAGSSPRSDAGKILRAPSETTPSLRLAIGSPVWIPRIATWSTTQGGSAPPSGRPTGMVGSGVGPRILMRGRLARSNGAATKPHEATRP
jgi:hypothetical protein